MLAGTAFGEPGYRFTTGHKTRVWSDVPGEDNTINWSGSRDDEGYATGRGSLTFYRVNWKRVTGSNIPAGKPIMAWSLTGKMVRGKFVGTVEMTTAAGVTTHAKFADGAAAGKWHDGSAPEPKAKAMAQESAPKKQEPSTTAAPAEGPSSSATVEINQPEAGPGPAESASDPQQHPAESNLLRSLTAPPSALPKTDSRLSKAEAIRAADEEAIKRGLKVGDYQNRKVNFNSGSAKWTVSYDRPVNADGANVRKHFEVTVEDKTSKAALTPEE